jgi:hypothetical protein
MALNIVGHVWGSSTTKNGKHVFYIENIAVLALNKVDPDELEGKRVMFVARYSGKNALFYATEALVLNEKEE